MYEKHVDVTGGEWCTRSSEWLWSSLWSHATSAPGSRQCTGNSFHSPSIGTR